MRIQYYSIPVVFTACEQKQKCFLSFFKNNETVLDLPESLQGSNAFVCMMFHLEACPAYGHTRIILKVRKAAK